MAGRKRPGLSTVKSFRSPCRGSAKPAGAPGKAQLTGLDLTEPQARQELGTRVGVTGEATVTAQRHAVGRRWSGGAHTKEEEALWPPYLGVGRRRSGQPLAG